MKIISVQDLALEGIKVLQYERYEDNRGYFSETFRLSDLSAIKGFGNFNVQQSNESYSKKNVLRGLHFQWNPKMGKLVRTIYGHMVDIVLDIRKGSPTFGKAILYNMPQSRSKRVGEWIWVPPGFAHGNFFLEDTLIEYYCTGWHNPDSERGISVMSKDLDFSLVDKTLRSKFNKILKNGVLISNKDKAGISLSDWQKDSNFSEFTYK